MKTIEIRHRWTNGVLYATDVENDDLYPVRTAVERANLDGARLDRASLVGAYLVGARLDGARLVGAYLDGASLDGASLDGASLDGARLDGAYLDGASLDGASLDGASLDGARLDGARLDGASLVGARLVGARLDGASLVGTSLDGASLDGANLDGIRDDFRDRLDRVPSEVPGLLAKLIAGEIDGSCYEGACACFVGTVANLRGVKYDAVPNLSPSASSPTERWFLAIKPGHTPENHPVAAITHDWICEWLAERGEGPWMEDTASHEAIEDEDGLRCAYCGAAVTRPVDRAGRGTP